MKKKLILKIIFNIMTYIIHFLLNVIYNENHRRFIDIYNMF